MVEKAAYHFAEVYKISQNRGGTLHSLGAFCAIFLAHLHQPALRAPGGNRHSEREEEYRYCEFTGNCARFQSWCKRLQERDRLHGGEFRHRELRTDQLITTER